MKRGPSRPSPAPAGGRGAAFALLLLTPLASFAAAQPAEAVGPVPGRAYRSPAPPDGGTRSGAQAEEPATLAGPELELRTVIREALEANPSLAAAEHRWNAARAAPDRLRDLPDPTIRSGIYAVPLDTLDLLEGQIRVQYSQHLPYPGTLDRRGRVAEREAERLGSEREAERVRVAADVRRAYWELYFAHRAQEIHHRHLELVRELSDSAEELYATGQVPQENVLRSLVEMTELFAELADVEARIGVARARLNAILHRPPDAPLGTPRPPEEWLDPPDLPELVRIATRRNPSLEAAELAVARERARVERERHEAKPDVTLMGEWWTASDGMGGRFERYAVLATLSLPWVHDDKYAAAVDEAMAERRAADADRLRLVDEIRAELSVARQRLEAAIRTVELYRSGVLPQAEQSLRAARSAYEAGTADFVTIVDNERTLLLARLALARAEVDAGIAAADLFESVGVLDADALAAEVGSLELPEEERGPR